MLGNTFNHQAGYIVARILTEIPNQKSCSGTGFFYLLKLRLKNGSHVSKMLLISNKHVFLYGKGKMIITLNRRRDKDSPDLGNLIKFEYDNITNIYFPHPDEQIDLACVDMSEAAHTDAFIKHISDEFLIDIDYNKVALGSQVLFVGYPYSRYDTVNNLPLARSGSLASLPSIDFEGNGEIVIDAQVFPGSSGSPVFIDWDDKYVLIGVISKTMMRDDNDILGLGIVIKQRHVRELINHVMDEVTRTAKIDAVPKMPQ